MAKLSMWLHLNPGILKQGRTKHADPVPGPGEEEVEAEELMRREVERDPWDARLKPVDQDAKTKGGLPAWVLRAYNVNTEQQDPKTGKLTVNNGTVVVKSLWWPGSVTFYNNQRHQQIYVGDGLKNEPYGCSFYPIDPPKMKQDKKKERAVYQHLFDPNRKE